MSERKTDSLNRFFSLITGSPLLVLMFALLLSASMLAGLPRLEKDTSISAFIPAGHPSLIANDSVKETFGLADAVAIAVVMPEGSDVFQPDVLTLLETISERLADIENLREDRIASIASESSIAGDAGAVNVDAYLPYFDGLPGEWTEDDFAATAESRRRLLAMPPHIGTLVSADHRAAIVMAEMRDEERALDTWQAVDALVNEFGSGAEELGAELYLAGPGAVSGYFSAYINKDVRTLLPIGFLLVLLFIFLAFLRLRALIGPMFVVIGAVGGALGVMGWMGVDYFAITNSLPVILVAIAVADAIHVLSAYYEGRQNAPEATNRELVVSAMTDMTRPIVLTTLTTMAGFAGLGMVSVMPPIQYFAWFAMLGVALACVYTLVLMPALLVLCSPGESPAFRRWQNSGASQGDWLGRGLLSVTRRARKGGLWVVAGFVIVACGSLTLAQDLRIDRSQVENFRPDEPLRIADEYINELFVGTGFLNVVVTSDEPGGLLGSQQMQAVAELQAAFDEVVHVQKTVSIVDYLSLLHSALEQQEPGQVRVLPNAEDALAQYLLVYEASGSPTDFEEEISADYSSALIRGFLNVHRFSESKLSVDALNSILAERRGSLAKLGLTAVVAGDVNITYHWMTRLIDSHFSGIGLALLLVFGMASLMFRSVFWGLLAVLPVAMTVLAVYAVMALLDISLDPPSSMFAAIAIGVGVDFSIHLLDRLRAAADESDGQLSNALTIAVPGTARACLFNALALAVGFLVLTLSLLPTLQRFGGFIALAAVMSFVTSLLLVPAVLETGQRLRRLLSRPTGSAKPQGAPSNTRVAQTSGQTSGQTGGMGWLATGLLVVTGSALLTLPAAVRADEKQAPDDMDALAVATKVIQRPEGNASQRRIAMELTDKRGKTRQRDALVIKRMDSERRYTRVTYLTPKSVREVSFLSHDQLTAGGSDDRWLYLPATRKVRRVPAADRGDYFLGTDFSYEDMQSELKFALEDYNFELLETPADQDGIFHLRGEPKTKKIVRELGYGAFEAVIDGNNWMPQEIRFFDPKLRALKTVTVSGVQQIDGIWNAGRIECRNERTGHTTLFRFSDTRYLSDLPERLFASSALSRGAPDVPQ